jgi:hypothetical protein
MEVVLGSWFHQGRERCVGGAAGGGRPKGDKEWQ